MLWIKKSDVLQLLQCEMSIEQLRADIIELREDGFSIQMYGKARKKYSHGKFWLTYSGKLLEQPVNLVVPTETLLKLPHTKHFTVTREKVRKA